MGVWEASGLPAALTLTIDPAEAKAALDRRLRLDWTSTWLGWGSIAMSALWFTVAGIDLVQRRPLSVPQYLWWVWLVYGIIWLRRPARLAYLFPSEVRISDDGVRYQFEPGLPARIVPWPSVRSVTRTDGALLVSVPNPRVPLLSRRLVIPTASDEAAARAALASLYRHLVAPEGLIPTPSDRIGFIRNTRSSRIAR